MKNIKHLALALTLLPLTIFSGCSNKPPPEPTTKEKIKKGDCVWEKKRIVERLIELGQDKEDINNPNIRIANLKAEYLEAVDALEQAKKISPTSTYDCKEINPSQTLRKKIPEPLFLAFNESTPCTTAIQNARLINEKNVIDIPPLPTFTIPKNEYEKSTDYKIRSDKYFQSTKEQTEKMLASAGYNGFVKAISDGTVNSQYDADKNSLTIDGSSALSPRPEKIKIGPNSEQLFHSTILHFESDKNITLEEKMRGTLGFKSITQMLYSTKLKHPNLAGKKKSIVLNMSPDDAKKLKQNLSIVMAGKLAPPYSHNRIESYARSRSTPSERVSIPNNSVVMEVTCAAIINSKSWDVIYEYK